MKYIYILTVLTFQQSVGFLSIHFQKLNNSVVSLMNCGFDKGIMQN